MLNGAPSCGDAEARDRRCTAAIRGREAWGSVARIGWGPKIWVIGNLDIVMPVLEIEPVAVTLVAVVCVIIIAEQ